MASCENCFLRSYAERKPDSLISRLWRWHTTWCPGWRSYQKQLQQAETPRPESPRPSPDPPPGDGGPTADAPHAANDLEAGDRSPPRPT